MNDLIKITQTQINGANTNSVDARDLHKTLGVKKAFTTWIKSNLYALGAIKDEDYLILKTSLEGSGYKKVYIITADIAKHLSMMSKTEKAKEVRDYFIEKEKQANSAVMLPEQITQALALTAQSLTLQDERMDAHNDRIKDVEQYIIEDMKNRPIDHTQQTALLNARHRKVFELLEYYDEDKSDKELKRKTYAKIGSLFKKKFDLPRYDALPNVKFDDGIEFLNNIKLKDI